MRGGAATRRVGVPSGNSIVRFCAIGRLPCGCYLPETSISSGVEHRHSGVRDLNLDPCGKKLYPNPGVLSDYLHDGDRGRSWNVEVSAISQLDGQTFELECYR